MLVQWVPSKLFFYQKQDVVQTIPFIIGIQTSWMHLMKVKHSHNNVMSIDSTFSTNKYGVSSHFFYSSIQLHFNAYTLYNYICFVCDIVSSLHFNGIWRTSQRGSSSLGDFFTQYYIWHMQMDDNINCVWKKRTTKLGYQGFHYRWCCSWNWGIKVMFVFLLK